MKARYRMNKTNPVLTLVSAVVGLGILLMAVTLFSLAGIREVDRQNTGFEDIMHFRLNWHDPDPNKIYEVWLIFREKGTNKYALYKWESSR